MWSECALVQKRDRGGDAFALVARQAFSLRPSLDHTVTSFADIYIAALRPIPQVLLNCAKEAPAAFLPHLEPLVARVQQLWDQVGRLA